MGGHIKDSIKKMGKNINYLTIPKQSVKKTLKGIQKRALSVKTDISDHLETMFCEALGVCPELIVELGVREGESTFVFERVAKLCGSTLISVDIDDCRKVFSDRKSFFVKTDDIAFAKEFETWCKERHIRPQIDVLFIDTSHLYDHTCQEISCWFPFLSRGSKVIFHDTNITDVYYRKDGSKCDGWDNERGVIRAIEEHLHQSYDEHQDFVRIDAGFLIRHYAHCAGLTILEKL
ncbi:MAG: class I SAM-dependent methyltransferase [Deltaproteobacteria bacterium]